jgi:hypothetical protein
MSNALIGIFAQGGGGPPAAPTTDPLYDDVIFLLGIDPNASPQLFDAGPKDLTVSVVNTPNIETAAPIGGSSASLEPDFGGVVRAAFDLAKNANFTFVDAVTGLNYDFTVEFWIQAKTSPGTSDGVLASQDSSGSERWVFWLSGGTANSLELYGANTLMIAVPRATAEVLDGNPYHIAWTKDVSTNINTLYVNGVQVGTYNDGGHSYGGAGRNLTIGEDPQSTSRRWGNGLLDGIRITRGLRYTAAFAPPLLPLPASAPP